MLLDRLRQSVIHGWTIAGLFGALVYIVAMGVAPLDVTNVAWIYLHDDIAGAYTGWSFYRDAPWSAEIAANPTYGVDFSGSILYSDAIPLLAIPLKALAPILPEPFQYFGWWTFLSFILQGVFGWLLMSRASDNAVVRILGACFIALTPVYMFRLTSSPHMSLTAHWLVLGALYLCVSPQLRRPALWWGLLIGATIFVHAYIFCMVATLWLTDLFRRALGDWRRTWIEPLALIAVLGALVWVTGIWNGPSGEFEGGFGWFKMNVFSFIDPDPWLNHPDGAHPSWSYLLPDIPNGGGDYEGFAYLGLGGLVLAAAAAWALPGVLRKTQLRPFYFYAPFLLALVGMGVFALSRNVMFGPLEIWAWWPQPLHHLGELFRATGRFIWPLYYFAFFLALLVLSQRLALRPLLILLAGAILVQAVDTSRGWGDGAYLRQSGGAYQSSLGAPFWSAAAERYTTVRIAPYNNNDPRFRDVATMARNHGLVTDAVYLSRVRSTAREESYDRIESGVTQGDWPTDTLFILDDATAQRVQENNDPARHFLARVDGFAVLAPDWGGCVECGATPIH